MSSSAAVGVARAAALALVVSTPLAFADEVSTDPLAFLPRFACDAMRIDFDDLPAQTTLDAQYEGVRFGGTGRSWNAQTMGGGGTFRSPPNVVLNFGAAPISIEFDPPVEAFAVFNPSLFDFIRVSVYGEKDVLLAEEVMPSYEAGVTFLGYAADEPIHRIEAVGVPPTTGGTIFLDDLVYGGFGGCTADLDENGVVDGGDLAILLGGWSGPGCGDLDRDGRIDGLDLSLLLAAWGACP